MLECIYRTRVMRVSAERFALEPNAVLSEAREWVYSVPNSYSKIIVKVRDGKGYRIAATIKGYP
jgi:hypothetical protein